MRIEVRPCVSTDLPLLERDLPAGEAHRRHLERQADGVRTYLGAFGNDRVVGTCVVSWDGCREPELREAFPDAVEIAGLHVGEQWRGQGVGSALVRAAERLAWEAGCRRLVIGVADDNPGAAALYRSLGYRETGVRAQVCYELPGADGVRVPVVEQTRALIKTVPDSHVPA